MTRHATCRAKRSLAAAILLAAAAALSGCASGSLQSTAVPAPALLAAIRVCDSGTPGCSGMVSASLGAVRDLSVTAGWENLAPGTHTQQVDFILPSGALYQSFAQAFSVPDGATGQQAVVQNIPVAGTGITQRGLTGIWTVRVALDGAAMGRQSVTLNP